MGTSANLAWKQPQFGRSRANIGQIRRPTSARICSHAAKLGPASTDVGQGLTKLSPTSGHRPNLARNGLRSAQRRPNLTRVRPTLCRTLSTLTELRPALVKSGPDSTAVGPEPANLGPTSTNESYQSGTMIILERLLINRAPRGRSSGGWAWIKSLLRNSGKEGEANTGQWWIGSGCPVHPGVFQPHLCTANLQPCRHCKVEAQEVPPPESPHIGDPCTGTPSSPQISFPSRYSLVCAHSRSPLVGGTPYSRQWYVCRRFKRNSVLHDACQSSVHGPWRALRSHFGSRPQDTPPCRPPTAGPPVVRAPWA